MSDRRVNIERVVENSKTHIFNRTDEFRNKHTEQETSNIIFKLGINTSIMIDEK